MMKRKRYWTVSSPRKDTRRESTAAGLMHASQEVKHEQTSESVKSTVGMCASCLQAVKLFGD